MAPGQTAVLGVWTTGRREPGAWAQQLWGPHLRGAHAAWGRGLKSSVHVLVPRPTASGGRAMPTPSALLTLNPAILQSLSLQNVHRHSEDVCLTHVRVSDFQFGR